MKCPACGYFDSKVVDSRPTQDGGSIRRRRECLSCQKRFTTFEFIETVQVFVIKKDGGREPFDRAKLLAGVMKACQKRPIDANAIVSDIEAELQNTLKQEVTTKEIGEMVLDRLRNMDEVAYVRFASVYREFQDIDTFFAEIKKLRHDINLAKDIFPMLDRLKEKLRIEMETEQEMFPRETGAKTQSKTKRNEERER